jgi:hypothetical protein
MPVKARAPGFLASIRAIEALKRFQDLARHYAQLPPDIGFARPLAELIPPSTKPEQQRWLIAQQINRLIPIVSHYFSRVGIDTHIVASEWEEADFLGGELKKVAREHDLVGDYFEMNASARLAFSAHRMLMDSLERAIGIYEARRKAALCEMFNPLNWIAGLIRIPIAILDRAGVEEPSSGVLKAYGWILRLLVLAVVGFAATKLGISIPWKEVAGFFR